MAATYGLEWVEYGLFGTLRPQWTVEPDETIIADVVREQLSLPDSAPCTVVLHAQGAFNKIYKVDTIRGSHVMRLSLPIEVPHKVQSELATAEFLSDIAGIPTPDLVAHCATCDNPLRFPWILMDFVPGQNLFDAWRSMSPSKKERLMKQLAAYHALVAVRKYDRIGSLFPANPETHSEVAVPVVFLLAIIALAALFCPHTLLLLLTLYCINRRSERASHVAIGRFLGVDFLVQPDDFSRGPYRNSFEWMHARTICALNDLRKENTGDEEDEQRVNFAERFLEALPSIFPQHAEETAYLSLHDLHADNILIDDDGNLAALLDWEFTTTLPAWAAWDLPSVLQGVPPAEEPKRAFFNEYEDNYRRALFKYELLTLYRPVFIKEMARLAPEWTIAQSSFQLEKQCASTLAYLESGQGGEDDDFEWLERAKRGEATENLYGSD